MGLESASGVNSEDAEANKVESLAALPGTLVRVRDGYEKAELDGMLGTITHSFGHPEFAALDVQLENGLSALFWFHELDAEKAGPCQGIQPEQPSRLEARYGVRKGARGTASQALLSGPIQP